MSGAKITFDPTTWPTSPVALTVYASGPDVEIYNIAGRSLYAWRNVPQLHDDWLAVRWEGDVGYRILPCWVFVEYLLLRLPEPLSRAAGVVTGKLGPWGQEN